MRKENLIKVQFWIDTWVLSLPDEEMIFYLYLLTNETVSVSGLYKLNLVDASRAVHTTTQRITLLLDKFEMLYQKLLFDSVTSEIYLLNWTRHHIPKSPSLQRRIEKEFDLLHSDKIRLYVSTPCEAPSHTPSPTPCAEEIREKKSNKRKEEQRMESIYSGVQKVKTISGQGILDFGTPSPTPSPPVVSILSPVEIIITYLNQKTGSHFRTNSAYSETFIQARFRQKFTIDDMKRVIDCKTEEWKGTVYAKFLRPNTLFHVKFESYLNQSRQPKVEPGSGYSALSIPALEVRQSDSKINIMEEVDPWKV